MKILAFTDPHGNIHHAKSIVTKASKERPDLVVCSGDFSISGDGWDKFFDVLQELGDPVYCVGGNHESEDLMMEISEKYPFVKSVAYTTVLVDGIAIGGIPGYDIDFQPDTTENEDALTLASSIWASRPDTLPFILLSHFPPAGTLDGTSSGAPDAGGSETLKKIVQFMDPALVITGHYHSEFGRSSYLGNTRIVNPGPSGTILKVEAPDGSLYAKLASNLES